MCGYDTYGKTYGGAKLAVGFKILIMCIGESFIHGIKFAYECGCQRSTEKR
jgi:hypothetical protein